MTTADKISKESKQKALPSEPCPECGRAFSRKDSLVRHLKVHGSNAERGPLHRIVHDKFRACNNCRKTKVRCPGNLPCARCEQLGQKCSYDKKRRRSTKTVLESPELISIDTDVVTPPSITSPATSTEHGSSHSPLHSNAPTSPPIRLEDLIRSQTINVPAPSPTIDTNITSHPAPRSEPDVRTASLNNHKAFSLVQSPYASPTQLILDPYSYKLPSIPGSNDGLTPKPPSVTAYRYPVMQYLAPFLDVDITSALACDLLDTYFSSAFSTRLHPTCHHLHNFIVRRCDVLDLLHPRKMHPALLASMLFVAALSDKALGLFTGPEERDRICKYLSLLTYRLLNPSRHEPLLSQEDLGLPPNYITTTGWTNQELQRALDPQSTIDCLPITWGVDYIITFIHVSSVISGSEKKAASIRWWNAAFSLARDLKLNQESGSYVHDASGESETTFNCSCTMLHTAGTDLITEVHREERRRTWWLLFLMDRHLALCYNRPLALLEAECKDLLLPLDDVFWQSGQQPHSHGKHGNGPKCMLQPSEAGRSRGPPITCTGPGLFEFFLPLMTITGHLLDFNRAKNHPVLVSADSSMFSSQERQILRELDHYQTSLDSITNLRRPSQPARRDSQARSERPHETSWANTSPSAVLSPESNDTEPVHITRTFSAYANHVGFGNFSTPVRWKLWLQANLCFRSCLYCEYWSVPSGIR